MNVGGNPSFVLPPPPLPEGAPGPYCCKEAATWAGVKVKSRVGDVLEGPAPLLERPCPMSIGCDGEDEEGIKLNWFAELGPPI